MKNNSISLIYSILFLFILSGLTSNGNAQTLSISSGFGEMSFVDFYDDTEHFYANYENGSHQYLKLSFNHYLPEVSFMNLYLNLEKSSGTISTSTIDFIFCGVGPTPSLNSALNDKFTIYRMGIGFMPVDLELIRNSNIRFKFGTELSRSFRTIQSSLDDTLLKENSSPFQGNQEESPVRDIAIGLIFEFHFGQLNLGNNFLVSPVYNANVGIFEEIETGYNTRSIRQSLGVALSWDLKPKVKISKH